MKSDSVTVSGEGTMTVQPDKAIVTLGVITENKNLTTAQHENAEITAKIIHSLLQLGIPHEKIRTSEYRIDTEYDYENGKQMLRGYKTTHLLQVTIDEIARTGRIVDTAVANGATSVSNLQFTLAHSEFYYNQALSLALRNAQQKAATLAQTLGVAVNQIPMKITEISQTPPPAPKEGVLYATSTATPIEPGTLQIKAQIRAEFSYLL